MNAKNIKTAIAMLLVAIILFSMFIPTRSYAADPNEVSKYIQSEIDLIKADRDRKAIEISVEEYEAILQFIVRIEELRDLVDILPNTMDNDHFYLQLDKLHERLVREEPSFKANVMHLVLSSLVQKIEQAEETHNQGDVDKARIGVNELFNGQIKAELQARLNAVQEKIDRNMPFTDIDAVRDLVVKATLSDVERYVGLGEKYNSKTWIVSALGKVEAIPSYIQSNPLYVIIVNDLTNRAQVLKEKYNGGISDQALQQQINVATNYVSQYEKYRTIYYSTKAQAAVSALPEGETTTALQARIEAVVPK